jgi:hypothetical protein
MLMCCSCVADVSAWTVSRSLSRSLSLSLARALSLSLSLSLFRPWQVPWKGLGVEGREGRIHHAAAAAPRRVCRLVAGALHDGRGAVWCCCRGNVLLTCCQRVANVLLMGCLMLLPRLLLQMYPPPHMTCFLLLTWHATHRLLFSSMTRVLCTVASTWSTGEYYASSY